jgi:hypothetical protein
MGRKIRLLNMKIPIGVVSLIIKYMSVLQPTRVVSSAIKTGSFKVRLGQNFVMGNVMLQCRKLSCLISVEDL